MLPAKVPALPSIHSNPALQQALVADLLQPRLPMDQHGQRSGISGSGEFLHEEALATGLLSTRLFSLAIESARREKVRQITAGQTAANKLKPAFTGQKSPRLARRRVL